MKHSNLARVTSVRIVQYRDSQGRFCRAHDLPRYPVAPLPPAPRRVPMGTWGLGILACAIMAGGFVDGFIAFFMGGAA